MPASPKKGPGTPSRQKIKLSPKLTTANSFKKTSKGEDVLLEASVASRAASRPRPRASAGRIARRAFGRTRRVPRRSQVRSERRTRGSPMVTVVREDLSTPGDPWAVSVWHRRVDGYEVRAYQPATGTEIGFVLSFCEIAAAASRVEYDPAAAAKTVSADTLRALHAGSPVKTPGPPRAPTPFALPRVAVTKWVEDVLPYAVELHYRPGASKPSLRLKQRFFAGMEGKRSREAAEYARRDAKTALGMPPQSTAGLPPRGAEPRCYA